MDINKCNIYFGNLKIKTGYFGQYKFYEDTREGLYLLKLGPCITTTRVITPNKTNSEASFDILELGPCTTTTRIITPYKTNTSAELYLLKLGE